MSATKTQTGSQGKGPGGGKPAGPAATQGSGLSGRLRDYLQTLIYEWRKITWPDKKQWKDSTIVVFIFTIFLMVVLFFFDQAVGWLINTLMGLQR